jgi:DnaK suppressor protein
MSDVDPDQIRAELAAKRAEICALLAETQEDAAPVALDQTQQGRLSRMDAMQRQEMAQAARRRRKLELERIDAALSRLDAGTFGECVRCGEEIAPERLAFDPTAPLCRACAGG